MSGLSGLSGVSVSSSSSGGGTVQVLSQGGSGTNSGGFDATSGVVTSVAGGQDRTDLHNLVLPELSGVELAMSLSPKNAQQHHQQHQQHHVTTSSVSAHHLQHLHQSAMHTTPFSVTDILSPIEESYRKLELAAATSVNPPSPYR